MPYYKIDVHNIQNHLSFSPNNSYQLFAIYFRNYYLFSALKLLLKELDKNSLLTHFTYIVCNGIAYSILNCHAIIEIEWLHPVG